MEEAHVLVDKDLMKVLLVEDDVVDRRLVERVLAKRSGPITFVVESAGSLSEAIGCLGGNLILRVGQEVGQAWVEFAHQFRVVCVPFAVRTFAILGSV